MAVNKLKVCKTIKALKRAEPFLWFSDKGSKAFNRPFNQKKLMAPPKKRKVSYSPISGCSSAVLVKTMPIKIKVEYLKIWKN